MVLKIESWIGGANLSNEVTTAKRVGMLKGYNASAESE